MNDITPQQARAQLAEAQAATDRRAGDRHVHALATAGFGLLVGGYLAVSRLAEGTAWQAPAVVFYVLLLVPIWFARHTQGNPVGLPLFLVAVVAAVGAITLRAHLRFAATSLPDQFERQHRTSIRWVRAADLLLVAAAVAQAIGLLVHNTDPASVSGKTIDAAILIVAAVIVLIASTVIEPATTRAAFGQRPGD